MALLRFTGDDFGFLFNGKRNLTGGCHFKLDNWSKEKHSLPETMVVGLHYQTYLWSIGRDTSLKQLENC